MNTRCSPKQLAIDLLARSTCSVQCAAVLSDKRGIYAWGHNHMGPDGLGEHAEIHCLKRSNRKRWVGSTLYVAAVRKRNQKTILSMPCVVCSMSIPGYIRVIYRDGAGVWRRM
jgi:alpha-tubulin suppressor-like RCC1 family protein